MLGRAAAGLRLLLDGGGELSEQERAWIDAQLSPVARIAEGLQLVAAGVRCGGDISDGLLVELERIADLSGCGAEIWLDRLPVEAGALVRISGHRGRIWPSAAVRTSSWSWPSRRRLSPALLESWPTDLAPLTVVGRLPRAPPWCVLHHEEGGIASRPRTSSRHFA